MCKLVLSEGWKARPNLDTDCAEAFLGKQWVSSFAPYSGDWLVSIRPAPRNPCEVLLAHPNTRMVYSEAGYEGYTGIMRFLGVIRGRAFKGNTVHIVDDILRNVSCATILRYPRLALHWIS